MKFIKIVFVFAVILFFVANKSVAQVPRYISQLINIDSIAQNMGMPVFMLREVYVFPENPKRETRYSKMARNFMKVYPYALLIKEEMKDIEKVLTNIPDKRQQRAYVEYKEKELKKKYKKEITKLTLSQGVMLVKLVDRETGNTSFELIKQLQGSLTAFFWQNIALLFDNNLKVKYDANGKDAEIEMLVKKYETGTL